MLQGSAKIASLVSSNYIYASVLYYFGIDFFLVPNNTLDEVCKKNGLNTKQVIQKLELAVKNDNKEELRELINYPVNLIIQYLKHAHSVFIKKSLPYIARLIENLPNGDISHSGVIKDLQLVFPLFAEDFIHHIYEEEDSLFSHIEMLLNAEQRGFINGREYYEIERYSLQQFALDHAEHDDEMYGVRKITRHYHLKPTAPLHLKVIFSELKHFEEKLKTHALVENHILFPKALLLEDKIIKMTFEKIKNN